MTGENRYLSYVDNGYFCTKTPSHWLTKSLRLLSIEKSGSFVDGPFGSDLKSNEYISSGVPLIQLNNIRDGQHILRNLKFISENKRDDLRRHIARPNEVVIAKMAEPVARAALVNSEYPEYVIVADCVKMSPDPEIVDFHFLIWAINCNFVRYNAELASTGTTRIRISLSDLKKLKIPYPPQKEQTKIANFLDHETAKIDRLIEKQQQLIKLLKEKRQAVISHAVTKGLDPTAPMRDSGVEWLGDVPAHWEVAPLKFFACIIDCKHITAEFLDEGIPLASISEVKGWLVDLTEAKRTSKNSYLNLIEGNRKPQSGDIIYSRNATVGEAALVAPGMQNFAMGQDVCLIRVSENILPEFILYVLQSKIISQQLDLAMIGSTFKRINVENIRNFLIALPNHKEQVKIANEIDHLTKRYDLMIYKVNQLTFLLKERRTALISAAVTGKIDVRDWQAPEETLSQKENAA